MILITLFSSMRRIPVPDVGVRFIDKIGHFAMFAVLGLFLCRGMHAVGGLRRYYLLAALLIGGCFAGSDELHQFFVSGRNASVGDWIADLAGLTAAGLGYDQFLIPAADRALSMRRTAVEKEEREEEQEPVR